MQTYRDLTVGDRTVYYPRTDKPPHAVEVIELIPHPFYGALVRFRYTFNDPLKVGRERIVAYGRFHTTDEQ